MARVRPSNLIASGFQPRVLAFHRHGSLEDCWRLWVWRRQPFARILPIIMAGGLPRRHFNRRRLS